MDRRTITALVLMALVIVVTPLLFPRRTPPRTADSVTAAMDSTKHGATAQAAANDTARAAIATAAKATPTASQVAAPPVTPLTAPATRDSITVVTPHARYQYINPGAAPSSVIVPGYKNLRPGHRDSIVVIAQHSGPLLHYRIALGHDTVDFNNITFAVDQQGTKTTYTSTNPQITLTYQTASDSIGDGFHTMVRGVVSNAPPGSALLIDLPSDFRTNEADTLDDQRHLAYGYKIPVRDPESIPFSKLDPGIARTDTGSFQWVNARDKYWLVALMQPINERPAATFRGLAMRGGQRVGRSAVSASATTSYPLRANGAISFDLYIGPQSWNELHAMGNELENVNPYASFLHAVVQPFVTIVMRVLLWMKATFHLGYGWVLVIFGIVIRVALWPLNQKAMRTSMQMQRLQPELQDLQKRYKSDPEKQREAMMKLYKDHKMSPFSPMLGCLPMMLPMPVLFALYFVFQNTIEFRGVSFLWLPDISLQDPIYLTPLLMGVSMYLLSWIGMRNMPANPQAKMMSYMMPVVMTFMFLRFASGLNLYYFVQNVAALPQQWMIARERAKVGTSGTASANVKRRT